MNRTIRSLVELASISLCSLLVLTACMASTHNILAPGEPFDRNNITRLKPGVTTLSEVLGWFGPPDKIIDGTQSMPEPIPPPGFSDVSERSIEKTVPTRVLTAPEGMVILVYVERAGYNHYSAGTPIVLPVSGLRIDIGYHEKELFIYLSKKDKVVTQVSTGL
ncbi:MAG: hypothetical protein MN733_17065 [Nitrososphaera sp.]|nr:hypothetical protein [Nitrososphaera sp.]